MTSSCGLDFWAATFAIVSPVAPNDATTLAPVSFSNGLMIRLSIHCRSVGQYWTCSVRPANGFFVMPKGDPPVTCPLVVPSAAVDQIAVLSRAAKHTRPISRVLRRDFAHLPTLVERIGVRVLTATSFAFVSEHGARRRRSLEAVPAVRVRPMPASYTTARSEHKRGRPECQSPL